MERRVTKRAKTLPPPPLCKRVAAYARVSSGKEAMLESLSAQVSYYNRLIGGRGDWELAGIYADEALTGTKETRLEFQRMLRDCRDKKIDLVITKSVTRFARNTVILLKTVRELKSLGVDVWFEKENIHAMSKDGELMLTILASYAQEESRSASENCKWRIRKLFQEGRLNTPLRMLGYRHVNGVIQIIPEEAEIVRRVFQDYLSGMGQVAIMKKLNDEKVPARNGENWNKSSIAGMLKNEKYTGEMLLQKTYVADHLSKKKKVNRGELPMYLVAENHEAIVSKETFEAVQREMLKRAEKFKAIARTCGRYPFSSIVRCGHCNKNYRRKITGAGKQYQKPVWICSTYNILGKESCSSQQIPENILAAKAAMVLGCDTFDERLFREKIAEIRVPAHNRLVFIFRDGHSEEVTWQNPSRKESWSEEMKQKARERRRLSMEKTIDERKER